MKLVDNLDDLDSTTSLSDGIQTGVKSHVRKVLAGNILNKEAKVLTRFGNKRAHSAEKYESGFRQRHYTNTGTARAKQLTVSLLVLPDFPLTEKFPDRNTGLPTGFAKSWLKDSSRQLQHKGKKWKNSSRLGYSSNRLARGELRE